MTEEQARSWMRTLADAAPARMPEFEAIWARKVLADEMGRGRRAAEWMDWLAGAVPAATGLALAVLLVLWQG